MKYLKTFEENFDQEYWDDQQLNQWEEWDKEAARKKSKRGVLKKLKDKIFPDTSVDSARITTKYKEIRNRKMKGLDLDEE